VFLSPQRERQQLKSAPAWGNFKSSSACFTMGIENRDGMVTAPGRPADPPFKQSGRKQMASAWSGLPAARSDLCAIGL